MFKKLFEKLRKNKIENKTRLFVGEIVKGYGVHVNDVDNKTSLSEYFEGLTGLYRDEEVISCHEYNRTKSLRYQDFYR